jgi:hypothetical protein
VNPREASSASDTVSVVGRTTGAQHLVVVADEARSGRTIHRRSAAADDAFAALLKLVIPRWRSRGGCGTTCAAAGMAKRMALLPLLCSANPPLWLWPWMVARFILPLRCCQPLDLKSRAKDASLDLSHRFQI